jgi:hypothetical protein
MHFDIRIVATTASSISEENMNDIVKLGLKYMATVAMDNTLTLRIQKCKTQKPRARSRKQIRKEF